jgi:spore germination protein KC
MPLFLKMATKTFLPFLFAVMTLITGCWDRKEVNNLSVIMAAGIDKAGEKNIELSVQVYNPRAAGGGQQQGMSQSSSSGGGGIGQTIVRSEVGSNIADAMSKLQEKLPRQIFWGHGEIFIIGEELAKSGLRDHIDFILRSPEIRDNANILISKGPAKRVLTLQMPLERDSAEMLQNLTDLRLGITTTITDLSQMLVGRAGAAVLPIVKYSQSEEKEGEPVKISYLRGAGILKKDKLIGFIDDDLTRGVMWIRNEIDKATVTVIPEQTESGFVSARLIRSQTKLIPRINGDEWTITVKSEAEGDMIQNTTFVDYSKPELAKRLEKDFSKQIDAKIAAAVAKVQKKMNADIFGFAQAFHRKYPKEWNLVKDKWDEKFPQVKVTFETDVRIERHGLSSPAALRSKQGGRSE